LTLIRHIRIATLIVLTAIGLGACEQPPTASERWCNGLCTAVRRCNFNDPYCDAKCVNQRPGLQTLSVAAADAESSCLAMLSCTALSGNEAAWKAETNACWQGTVMSVAATSESRAFCKSHARFIFGCGFIYGLEDCAQDYALWSADVLARIARCDETSTCETFPACERLAVSP
jgi:hypothetical protein